MPFTSSTSFFVKPNFLSDISACSTCNIKRNFPVLIGAYANVSGNFVVFSVISTRSLIRVFRKSFCKIGNISLFRFILQRTKIVCELESHIRQYNNNDCYHLISRPISGGMSSCETDMSSVKMVVYTFDFQCDTGANDAVCRPVPSLAL